MGDYGGLDALLSRCGWKWPESPGHSLPFQPLCPRFPVQLPGGVGASWLPVS